MSDTADWLEKWLEPNISAEAYLFVEMLEPGERRVKVLRAAFEEVKDQGQDAIDYFIDEGAPAEAFLVQVSDVCLVAMYHWVERTAKTRLVSKLRKARKASSDVGRLNFDGLVKGLDREGVAVRQLPGLEAIDILRMFANSWKHEPDAPDESFCGVLGLSPGRRGGGHLADDDLRTAMFARLGGARMTVAPDAPDVVRSYAKVAADFLEALLRA